jgi:hypothetical protein
MTEINKKEELLRMLNTLDPERLSKEDFVNSFEKVVQLIKGIEEKNLQEVDQLKGAFENVSNQLKDNNSVDLQDVKAEISKQLASTLKEQQTGMNFIHDKVRGLKNGNDGLDGNDGADGKDGKDGLNGKDVEEIVEKELREELKLLRKDIDFVKFRPMPTGSGAQGGGIVKVYDLSDSLDGVTKTFSLPAYWRVLTVDLSSFPRALRPTVDFTADASNSTITFTSEIDAGTSLATGQTCIVTYAEA